MKETGLQMRVLGIDHGDARVGVAVSDLLGFTAQGVTTIAEKDPEKQIQRILEYVNEYQAESIVMGFPKNMNGTVGERGEITKAFAEKLQQASGIPVILWDERLSSAAAHRTLSETGVSGKKRKGKVDTLAAAFILQGYLNSK